LLGLPAAGADQGKQRTEAEYQAELKKLAQPPDPAKLKDLTPDEARARQKQRAAQGLDLLKEFEAGFPKSPALNEARVRVLDLFHGVEDDPLRARAAKVAEALRANSAPGSDLAARADRYLLGQDLRRALKGCKSIQDFRTAWAKNADVLRQRVEDYLAKYPKSRPAADYLGRLAHFAEMAGDEKTPRLIRKTVAKNLPDHPLARAAAREGAVGKVFDWSFAPVGSNRKTSLKDLRGKVVVIDFWTSWSVPCRSDLTDLKEWYGKYHKDGLEIVGVNLDEKEDAATKYIKENKVGWAQVVGPAARKLAETWGIESVPAHFVVDRKGCLRRTEALADFEEFICKLLAEKQ
jgi:thiol-disulfide isomerase/thioredoxin